jgi:hypothetical protein
MLRIVVLTAIAASIFGLAELFFGASAVYASNGSAAWVHAMPVIGWIVAG